MEEATIETGDPDRGRLAIVGWTLFAALLFGGIGYYLHYSSDQSRNIRAMTATLRDPGSAEVSEVNTVDGLTCGLVNAKNAMGGYTGRQIFVVDSGVAYIGEDAAFKLEGAKEACTLDALMVAVRAGS